MTKRRRIYDAEAHAQFVTFSCYHRRNHLSHDRAKRIVLGTLAAQLSRLDMQCGGFVIMPNHVHALVWSQQNGMLSKFMKAWKQQSSLLIKSMFRASEFSYVQTFSLSDPIWQARYYPFNVFEEHKAIEKLNYMHLNPVVAGLVRQSCDWRFSSARYYESGKSVGVPLSWPFA